MRDIPKDKKFVIRFISLYFVSLRVIDTNCFGEEQATVKPHLYKYNDRVLLFSYRYVYVSNTIQDHFADKT